MRKKTQRMSFQSQSLQVEKAIPLRNAYAERKEKRFKINANAERDPSRKVRFTCILLFQELLISI